MYDFDPDSLHLKGAQHIGGRAVAGTGQNLEVRRPSDGHEYGQIPRDTAEEVDRAVENASHACKTGGWPTMLPRDRIKIVRKWADLIDADAPALAPPETLGSRLANDTTYSRAARVFTADLERGLRAIRRLEARTVWVNRYGCSHDFILRLAGSNSRVSVKTSKDLGRQVFEPNLKFKTALIEFAA